MLKTETRCVLKPARKVKLVFEVAHLRTITSMDGNQISKLIAYSNGVYPNTCCGKREIHPLCGSNKGLLVGSGTCDEGRFTLVITKLRIHGAFDLLSSFVCIERDLACH